MDLYGQDAELRLLSQLVTRLDQRTVIDVGAEQGTLAAGMLAAGVEALHAFEPHPANVEVLRTRFASDARVTVHEYAVSDSDGAGELHVSTHPDGVPLPFGHTLLTRPDTDEIMWADTLKVTRRSLHSLVQGRQLPEHVGILKVDTEGHDLAVVQGMGTLEADVVMVEHWKDLPNSLGACPWTTDDMAKSLGARGFTHFAFVVHRGDFVTLKWDDGEVERGAMGNLVFIHDRVLVRLLPDLLNCAGWLAEQAVAVGRHYMITAGERLAVMEELEQASDDRLALVHELEEVAEARQQKLETITTQLKDKSAELERLKLQNR
jgi:FkbM family methyltransferase